MFILIVELVVFFEFYDLYDVGFDGWVMGMCNENFFVCGNDGEFECGVG